MMYVWGGEKEIVASKADGGHGIVGAAGRWSAGSLEDERDRDGVDHDV